MANEHGGTNEQLSGNDDTLSFGYTVSNTAERHSFTGRYYLPFLPLEAMGVAIGIGYSSYDASTFAKASVIDFDGETLYGDLGFSLKSAPFAGESLIAGMEFGLKLENICLVSTTPRRVGSIWLNNSASIGSVATT